MPTKLDWQTEDETAWEEEPGVATRAARSWRWPLLAAAVSALLLGAFSWLLFRQADQRLQAALQAGENDVLSTHSLVRQAAEQGDVELFRLLLSGRDPSWRRDQEDLLAAGLLFTPTPLGFQPQVGSGESTEPVVTLSPDLTSAEVTFARPYHVEGIETPVQLQHIAVYRRGAQRWLLSPPDSAFWGEQAYQTGSRLTLVYPQRDEAIARRLFADLEARLLEMCRVLADLDCPQGLHITVRLVFETPSALALPAEPLRPFVFGNNVRLELPAPTLAGLPVDEAAYQALARGYAHHVVSALITLLVGYDCCHHGLFYQALLDRQISMLGLRPWPERPQLPLDSAARVDLAQYWEATTVTYPSAGVQDQLYALVDFVLAADSANSVAAMQRRLGEAHTYHTWLNHFIDGVHLAGLFAGEHVPLVNPESPASSAAPLLSLPDQEIQLVCQDDVRRVNTLYRYDPATATLTQEYARAYPENGFVNIVPLGHDRGYVLHEQVDGAVVSSWLALLRDGEEIVVAQDEVNNVSALDGLLFTGETSPEGRYLVLSSYGLDRTPALKLLDLGQCRPGDCPLQSLYGMPIWSPDGMKTLTLERTLSEDDAYSRWQTLIYRGDGWGQWLVMVGAGGNPFWLNDRRYGYVRLNGQRQTEVVTAVVNGGAARVWLRPPDLLAAIPPGERPDGLYVWQVALNPADNQRLAVVAMPTPADNVGPYFFFLARGNRNWSGTEEVALLAQHNFPATPHFSPDGRWLLFTSRGAVVTMHDTMTGRTVAFDQYGEQGIFSGWSADGQWLLQKHDDHFSLIAPAYDTRLMAQRDFSGCYNVLWAEE